MDHEWWESKEESGELSRYIYKGVPNKEGEQTGWQKFLTWICPWLREKIGLGDEYLKSQVRKENAVAAKEESEAILNIEKANKFAAEATEIKERLEKGKMKNVASMPPNATEDRLSALEEKIKEFRLLYGGRIIEAKEEKPDS